ncbi:hypothetical protein LEP1GSC126_0086 [Leptospira kirschneri str. 200801774]|nr:hypothetical protein LEP1GSC126_0086 [Leptospira kirschneri str. 200801774]
MTLRNAAKLMEISPHSLQKIVHDLKLIRFAEEYNEHNQRTLNLDEVDVFKLLELKRKGNYKSWKAFLTIFSPRSPIKLHSLKYVREMDPEILRKISN